MGRTFILFFSLISSAKVETNVGILIWLVTLSGDSSCEVGVYWFHYKVCKSCELLLAEFSGGLEQLVTKIVAGLNRRNGEDGG